MSNASVSGPAMMVKTSDMGFRWIGFIIVIACFFGGGWWSMQAPIERAIYGSGTVKVSSNRKTIQHLEGGQVEQLLVKDGEQVKQGDLLIVLDSQQYQAQLEIANKQLLQSVLVQQRLRAEQQGKANINLQPLAEFENDQDLIDMVASQSDLLMATYASLNARVDGLHQKAEQIGFQTTVLRQNQQVNQQLLDSYTQELADQQQLLDKGFAQINVVRDLERRIASLKGDMEKTASGIIDNGMSIDEIAMQIDQLQKDRASEVLNQLAEHELRQSELEQQIQVLNDKIERTYITAPVSGYILGLNVHTIGGVISPSKPVLDIIPQQDRLIIETQIPINDIDALHIGSTAGLRFSVFNEVKSVVIDGEVEYISADRLASEQQQAPYYIAHIAVTEAGMAKLGDRQLIPGMPAEVLINTGSRTLLEYLLQPALDAYSRSFIEE